MISWWDEMLLWWGGVARTEYKIMIRLPLVVGKDFKPKVTWCTKCMYDVRDCWITKWQGTLSGLGVNSWWITTLVSSNPVSQAKPSGVDGPSRLIKSELDNSQSKLDRGCLCAIVRPRTPMSSVRWVRRWRWDEIVKRADVGCWWSRVLVASGLKA